MKKTLTRGLFIILLMLPVIAFAHFMVFPQETRCMLIRFADFEKKDNIYFRANTTPETITALQQIQIISEKKVKLFWGNDALLNYKLIYCNNEQDFKNYGQEGAPGATQRKMGVSVVLQKEGLDTSIVAHEISHGILYNNIGWYKTTFKIPVWFDEGLAMQVDDRDYYSIENLMQKKNAGVKIPDVTGFDKAADFFAGDPGNIMLNFSAAKYTVHEWLKTHSLKKFIDRINNGESFSKAYNQKD